LEERDDQERHSFTNIILYIYTLHTRYNVEIAYSIAIQRITRYMHPNMSEASYFRSADSVNRTRYGTCVDRVVLVLWKEQSMYAGANRVLGSERASVRSRMG
jgi:hypothetical protein